MSGVTNQLVGYCNEVSSLIDSASLSEYDSVLASGEQVTGSLALELQSIGCKSRSMLVGKFQLKLMMYMVKLELKKLMAKHF